MKALVKATLLTASAGLFSVNALAQDISSTVRPERNPSLRHTAIEIKPVESLISATPGIASGGASVESYIGHNFAINVGGTYADINLPQKYIGTVNDRKNSPLVSGGYDFSVGAGIRYYDAPIGDSLYGGLDVDYSEARNKWEFHDERYTSERFAVTPYVVGGYRWVWQNGALLRLGVGVGLPDVQSQKVTQETAGPNAEDGLDKINDVFDQKVLAKLDVGVGMMF